MTFLRLVPHHCCCCAGGFRLVCDPKSLLYLFGMHLDYSSALVGGGFQFNVRVSQAAAAGV